MANKINVNVRLHEDGVEFIDGSRGSWSRSEYVRQALKLAAKHGLKGPASSGF